MLRKPYAAFRQGLISDLGNQKMARFFASILPQFAIAGEGMFSGLALLGIVFAGLTFVWLAFYAMMLAKLGHFLDRLRIQKPFEAIMGSLLVGVRLAAEQRG
jgi:threonine/homoserine/homoserine lactone efflux protein